MQPWMQGEVENQNSRKWKKPVPRAQGFGAHCHPAAGVLQPLSVRFGLVESRTPCFLCDAHKPSMVPQHCGCKSVLPDRSKLDGVQPAEFRFSEISSLANQDLTTQRCFARTGEWAPPSTVEANTNLPGRAQRLKRGPRLARELGPYLSGRGCAAK